MPTGAVIQVARSDDIKTEREWMRTFEARLSTLYTTKAPELRSCVLTRRISFISLFGQMTELASVQIDLF
jgi:hypothetical protein